MLAARSLATVPAPAATLGLAGVLPFIAGAFGAWGTGAIETFANKVLLTYGAVILSFLGGIHWGFLLNQADLSYRRLGLGVMPSLVGWAALLLGSDWGLLLLAVAFVVVLVLDLQLAVEGKAPAWFPRLRVVLTNAVVLCLLVALLG